MISIKKVGPEDTTFAEQALEIEKTKLASRHPNTATAINNLALLYDRIGDRTRA